MNNKHKLEPTRIEKRIRPLLESRFLSIAVSKALTCEWELI